MKYVRVTVDGVTYNLYQGADGAWRITNRAPLTEGEYAMTVTAVTEAGSEFVFDTSDENLIEALTLLVVNDGTISGQRMLNYYPEAIKVLLEFQALMYAEGFEIDFLTADMEFALSDAYLYTMGEERVVEWEKWLNIKANATDSLEDRREIIISKIRGQGKLNTESIANIVKAFTNGTAKSYIENSTLYVKVQPPRDNKQYKFENIERELRVKTPAHLGLVVTRDYATWKEIRDNFASWEAVRNVNTWEDIMLYVAPQ